MLRTLTHEKRNRCSFSRTLKRRRFCASLSSPGNDTDFFQLPSIEQNVSTPCFPIPHAPIFLAPAAFPGATHAATRLPALSSAVSPKTFLTQKHPVPPVASFRSRYYSAPHGAFGRLFRVSRDVRPYCCILVYPCQQFTSSTTSTTIIPLCSSNQ